MSRNKDESSHRIRSTKEERENNKIESSKKYRQTTEASYHAKRNKANFSSPSRYSRSLKDLLSSKIPILPISFSDGLLGLVDVTDGEGREGQVVQRHVLRVDAHYHRGGSPLRVNVQYEEPCAY